MTPHELRLAADAERHRRQSDYALAVMQAYYTAAWLRSRKMPRLNEVLRKLQPKEPLKPQTPQTPEEQFKQMMLWHAHLERRETVGDST